MLAGDISESVERFRGQLQDGLGYALAKKSFGHFGGHFVITPCTIFPTRGQYSRSPRSVSVGAGIL